VPRVHLTFACGDYDRTRALEDGSVEVDGVDLTYLRLPVEETFFRMLRHREFDVAEMSLSTYVATFNVLEAGEEPPFVALPVYTSRMFRHGGIFINTGAGIDEPADLRGKVVGTPEYQLTACVWIRGILADTCGVPLDAVRYVTGGQETPGRIEKSAVQVPFDVRPIGPGETLSALLAAGGIDALYSPRIPGSFMRGDDRVARLFPDTVAAEKAYYAATGIFPIMHVVTVRREIYQRYRWVAQSLTKALTQAKQQAYDRIYDASALRFMEPWLNQHLEDARRLLGEDYWSYGLGARDRNVLETFLRYHHEQGLSLRLRTPDQLFAPEALEAFVI
jgi:ABC-type nitrate/sulfonate/bicarbonate transport system substrate-binding protein